MKKTKLKEIKENIEKNMVTLNEYKKDNDKNNVSIDKKIQELKDAQNEKSNSINKREGILDDCTDALEEFLKEEDNNKKLLRKLDKQNSIFNSGAKFFGSGKQKLQMYDHTKVSNWHEAEDDYLMSNRRLHKLYMKLNKAEANL